MLGSPARSCARASPPPPPSSFSRVLLRQQYINRQRGEFAVIPQRHPVRIANNRLFLRISPYPRAIGLSSYLPVTLVPVSASLPPCCCRLPTPTICRPPFFFLEKEIPPFIPSHVAAPIHQNSKHIGVDNSQSSIDKPRILLLSIATFSPCLELVLRSFQASYPPGLSSSFHPIQRRSLYLLRSKGIRSRHRSLSLPKYSPVRSISRSH